MFDQRENLLNNRDYFTVEIAYFYKNNKSCNYCDI